MATIRIPDTAYRLLADVRRGLQQSKRDNMFVDTYELWVTNRPLGRWDRGETPDSMTLVGSGFGKLYASGVGGPRMGDGVIYPESPYRFRAERTLTEPLRREGRGEPDVTGTYLVVNRSRLFMVDMVKPEDRDDLLVDVYLSELIGKAIPEFPEVTP